MSLLSSLCIPLPLPSNRIAKHRRTASPVSCPACSSSLRPGNQAKRHLSTANLLSFHGLSWCSRATVASLPRTGLHPRQITSAISSCSSLAQLLELASTLQSRLNSIHIAAIITRAAKLLTPASGSQAESSNERSQPQGSPQASMGSVAIASDSTHNSNSGATTLIQLLLHVITQQPSQLGSGMVKGAHSRLSIGSAASWGKAPPVTATAHFVLPLLEAMGPRELSNILWGLGAMRVDAITTISGARSSRITITTRSQPSNSTPNQRTLAASPQETVTVSLASLAVGELIAEGGRKMRCCSTQEASNVVWGMARLWPGISSNNRAAQLIVLPPLARMAGRRGRNSQVPACKGDTSPQRPQQQVQAVPVAHSRQGDSSRPVNALAGQGSAAVGQAQSVVKQLSDSPSVRARHALAQAAGLCLGAVAATIHVARPQEISAAAWAAAELGCDIAAAAVLPPLAGSTVVLSRDLPSASRPSPLDGGAAYRASSVILAATPPATDAVPSVQEQLAALSKVPWWDPRLAQQLEQQHVWQEQGQEKQRQGPEHEHKLQHEQPQPFPVALCKAVAAGADMLEPRALATIAHALARLRHRDVVALAALQRRLQVLASEEPCPLSQRDIALTAAALAQLQSPGLGELLPNLAFSTFAAGPAAAQETAAQNPTDTQLPLLAIGASHSYGAGEKSVHALLTLAWAHAAAGVHVPWMAEAVLAVLGVVQLATTPPPGSTTSSPSTCLLSPATLSHSDAATYTTRLPSAPALRQAGQLPALERAQACHYLLVARDNGTLPDWALEHPRFPDVWQECCQAWLECKGQRGLRHGLGWEAGQADLHDWQQGPEQAHTAGDTADSNKGQQGAACFKASGRAAAVQVNSGSSLSAGQKLHNTSALQQDVLRVCRQLVALAATIVVPDTVSALSAGLQHMWEGEAAGSAQQARCSGAPLTPAGWRQCLSSAQVLPEHRTADGLFAIDVAVVLPMRLGSIRPVPLLGRAGAMVAVQSSEAQTPAAGTGEGLPASATKVTSKECSDVHLQGDALCLAVEVDGPSHFTFSLPRQQLGAAALRDRCLMARGWQVLSVPWWEWDALGSDDQAKLEYVGSKLKEAWGQGSTAAASQSH